MDVDSSAAVSSRSPTSEPPTSALQEVAASLASVKGAIRSGAADRNQVIDMLTNLLRETLQVGLHLNFPAPTCSTLTLVQLDLPMPFYLLQPS